MEPDTEVLRKAAPEWNLAGDKQLLQILEQMHQKIILKCQEVNTKLDEMANKLDNASVNMQNVNNKFMALSNSQFIESRVYDDDIISDEESIKKAAAPADPESEISKIKRSLQTFEAMHEAVRILDSDSSDEEEDIRTILKPKAIYSNKPLPYIIGSHIWRNKWHVGLVPSDSESDSSAEFPKAQAPREQYSESESEDESRHQLPVREVSSSSEAESEPNAAVTSPADIAAQIAKRLTAQQPPLEPEPREMPIPETVPRKVYRADQPSAAIFSEEPPPLDDTVDGYSDEYSDDDDIFAELHKKPNTLKNRESRPSVIDDPFVDQLFGDETKDNEIQNNYKLPPASDKPTLYEDDFNSNVHTQREVVEAKSQNTGSERIAKKPIGGKSLFGSSKGAESIGAAILKRNQRKSSTSDEENNDVEENTRPTTNMINVPASTNKIIEDLFAKPKPNKKETEKVLVEVKSQEQEKKPKPKIDLFSDNIFDDIDDIFTAEIVTKPKQNNQKSIFDEDELFADIPTKISVSEKNKKSLFDSDDELFKEDLNLGANIKKNIKETKPQEVTLPNKNESSKKIISEKTIFSDDSDDIFSSNNNTPSSQAEIKVDIHHTASSEDHVGTLNIQRDNIQNKEDENEERISKILNNETEIQISAVPHLNVTSVRPKQFESPLLFGEDEIDDLFINKSNSSESSKDLIKNEKKTEIKIDKDKKTMIVNEPPTQEDVVQIKEETLGHEEKFTNIILDKVEELETKGNNIVSQIISDDNIEFKDQETDIESLPVKNIDCKNVPIMDSVDHSEITKSLSIEIKQENNQNDMFDDIFSDLPPDFEKPSEPKKSKNINALFDDDSDDENLFFKKSDIHEEKPEAIYNDDRFRIFHDEPPDIDIDFSQKSNNEIKNVESDEDLFSLPKERVSNKKTPESPSNKIREKEIATQIMNKDYDVIIKKQESDVVIDKSSNITKSLDSAYIESKHDKSDCTTKKTTKNETSKLLPEKDTVDLETDKKSVGKLKPMNININVNSLLPGASPSKQKPRDESDGLAYSTKSNEELSKYSSQKEESMMVKSVSFDGDPESKVLDNKLSKGRAKIQVKRRPSSRRARLEAVRKSGIDFGDDSTDNSSSFDEPKPDDLKNDFISKDVENRNKTTDDEIVINRVIKNETSHITVNKNIGNIQNIVNTETKSKTVYILHDEDIFTDSPITQTDNNKQSLTILDDDDDILFKNANKCEKNIDESQIEKEIENKSVSKISGKNKQEAFRTSIFDDLSDDELFGGKDGTKMSSSDKVVMKTETLESKTKVKKTVIAGNLFGDDSDDDLFRTAKSSEIKPMKSKEGPSTITKPVTDDPLSLFDDS